MATREELDAWLADGETNNLDFKGPLAFVGADRAELAKDIIAMTNTADGGIIVIGVNDDRSTTGLTREQVKSWDPTKIHDYLQKYCQPVPEVQVEIVKTGDGSLAVLRVSEFKTQPVITTKQLDRANGSQLFGAGVVLVREGVASTAIRSAESMRSLLERAIQRRSDQLLLTVGKVVRGDSSRPAVARSYPTEEAYVEDLLPDGWSVDQQGQPLPVWTIMAEPQSSWDVLYATLSSPRLWLDASVRLRGGDMPAWDSRTWTTIHDSDAELTGLRQLTNAYVRREGWIAFDNGFFGMARVAPENLWAPPELGPAPSRRLDPVEIVHYLTEVHLFCQRYYRGLGYDGAVRISIVVDGLEGLTLVPWGVFLSSLLTAKPSASPTFRRTRTLTTTDLGSRIDDVIVDTCVRLYALFDWEAEAWTRRQVLEDLGRAGYSL